MTRGTQTAAHKIAEGLQEALAIAKGEAEPHRWHNLQTPIPSQDGKTESEGLASAPVTEQPETANQSGPVLLSRFCSSLATREADESVAPHSEQARFPSQGALEADPVGFPQAGSADPFNDTGPHVFSDSEVPA